MKDPVLYSYLPEAPPKGWVQSHYISATHYLAHYLFNTPNEFSDLWRMYLLLRKEPPNQKHSSHQADTRVFRSYLTDYEKKEILPVRGIMSNWETNSIERYWLKQDPNPAKRELIDELFVDLELRSALYLPPEGWVARTPYNRAEKEWREDPQPLPECKSREAVCSGCEGCDGALEFLLEHNPPQSPRTRAKRRITDPVKRKDVQDREQRDWNLRQKRVRAQFAADREFWAMQRLEAVMREDLKSPDEDNDYLW